MPSTRRTLLYAAGALSAVALVAVGATTALADDGAPRGTRVAGVDVSGLSRAQVQDTLGRELATLTSAPVALVADGQALELDPVRAGLGVDLAATARDATSAGPVDRLRSLVGARRTVTPTTTVDGPALQAELGRLAVGFDRAPREGAVRFTSAPVPVPALPLTGRELNRADAAKAVADDWPSADPIEVPVTVEAVKTTEQDVLEVLREVAVPAIAAPVTVNAPGGSVVVEPIDIAKALRIETDATGELTARLEPGVLYERLRERLKAVGRAPVDATFRVTGSGLVLVPSQDGTSISAADLTAAVLGVLGAPAPRTAQAPLSASAARVSTEQARQLGIVEPIGSFTSRFPCCRPRVQNIKRIAQIVNGYVILPGEQFDLNGVVGPRDKARGFVEAPQILDGEFVDRVGGGVSQFATTLFNAVFFSGLKDITHSPHSYYISRYPPGREATVSFPRPELIFENDSGRGVLVTSTTTATSVTVAFYGTKRFDEVRSSTGPRTRIRDFTTQYVERPDCSATSGGKGFDIVVTRVFVDGGRELRREPFRTRYRPQPKVVCGPPPGAAASPAPSGSSAPPGAPAPGAAASPAPPG